MMNVVVVVVALALASVLAFAPQLRSSRAWDATVTPLSSIMGSGFLVSAPLVASVAGVYSPLFMAALLVVAQGIGAMIRFNIRYAEALVEPDEHSRQHTSHEGHRRASADFWSRTEVRATRLIERGSHVVLAFAYVISVSYYLQLLAAFALDQLGVHDQLYSRIGTTAVLAGITATGARWGLRAMERVETWAVSLNLGTIGALLVGLLLHDGGQAFAGTLQLPDLGGHADPWHAARVMMGLLIVVQGFETSRFLGAEHSADERIRTMWGAQTIAAVIYLVFVTLMVPLLHPGLEADVTAIVGLVQPVAPVLPLLIVVAAIGSQFSAAVADDAGCAGLVEGMLGSRVPARYSYLAIGLLSIGLTWITDVLSVISIASRAFALFYALQCAVTVGTAWERDDARHRWAYLVAGVVFGLVALAVAVFGVPAE